MNTPHTVLEDLQQRLSQLLRSAPTSDLERNVRAVLAQGFQKLELVTREEFEIQQELLKHAQERIRALEARVDALESKRQ
jgi:ubiquinone biosynthesis accessory factor UbiK